ncbi:glycosyltransferase [Candidatus Planktophila limnetica]|uniref:Glycosyltransferase n=1 Tax=Candidatus Planktophila limnetica TaxID=573600 RepID=A0A249LE34_9ACTN|nr:glycosyltransferase [Candidatus Planktophila limnetica]ASY27186.1 glycosyltransferase [Candidatus Planktophila limnetica]
MRVLHVIARLNVGGTARYITRLAEELPKHKIETYVAAGFVQGFEQEDPSAKTLKVIRIPSLGRQINPFKDHFALKQLLEVVKEVKPDILHTHTFKAGFIGRIKTKEINKAAGKRVKFVHTFHGHLFDDPEFSGLKSLIITSFERRFAMRTDAIVTVGAQVAKELLEREIGQPEQFTNIPPGVEPLKIPKAKQRKKITIGWIARVTGVKNPLRALEIAKLFPDAQFLIAGGGDMLDEVKAQAPKNTKVLGWTDAPKLFAASDIILSTSENEGMPIALIEAQLASKPVVATNVGGVAEVVINNKTGFVTPKNTEELARALEKLINSKALRTAQGKAAKAHATKAFSVEKMISAHVSLYKKLAK